MRELSLSGVIVNTVLKQADGRKLSAVDVRIGALRQVVPESLVFYFGIVARDTVCEEAELRLDLLAAWLRCPACELEWDPAPQPALDVGWPTFHCPTCGSAEFEILAGDELEVASIEIEEARHRVLSA
jgi:hydrogenase nickel incorporation protein HypA/HybF